jgi:type IX secretion system PorP/SprF family membrane protein
MHLIINILKKSLIIVWILLCTNSLAQQDPLYTQYQFNTLAINPAYAGSRDMLSVMLLARQQWAGFDGAPQTASFSAHSPITSNHVSLGLSVTNDQIGPVSQTLAFADYAYRFAISHKARLALGLKAGLTNMQIDYNSLAKPGGSYDPAYEEGVATKLLPNFGFGIYLSHPSYYLGVSAPRLIENDLSSDATGNAVLAGHEVRNYYLMGGVMISLASQLKLKPSFMLRITEASPPVYDLNLNFLYREKLWFGAMWRPDNAAGAILQYQITSQFRIGYAYEISLDAMKNFNNGTNEVMLSYDFVFKKQKVFNPRYF